MSIDNFFVELKKVNPSAAILSTVLEHSDNFVPKSCTNDLPVCLSSLYNSRYFDLPYHELLTECIKVYDSIAVTHQQATSLEKITRKQSNSKVWFRHRAGRITASRFKAASSTNIALPSQSLIKAICYPESQQFKTSATW